jgi:hypothetical protein
MLRNTPKHHFGSNGLECDEDMNYITCTSTPAAPEAPRTSTPAAPEAPQAPSTPLGAPPAQTSFPPPGPITRARARELNYIMLLKNEGPEEEDGLTGGPGWGA